jgi:radical SAM protein with 4Fe4S-binding SPASM domain
MDPKKKFYLFKQSQHFCSVPWNHVKVDANGQVKTCVRGRAVLGNIKNQTITEILKNPVLQEIRETLYNDRLPENCVNCQTLENQTSAGRYQFLRNLYNSYFLKKDVDYSDFSAFNLAGIDLHWGSTCNLKCITCWEKQSSAIAQELKIPILNNSESEVNSVLNLIIDNQHNLQEIYLSGGEPTLIKHNLRLLQSLSKNNDLLLRVNSNFTFDLNNQILQEILKFPNVLFTVSADSTDHRFNYMRSGADWNQFVHNITELKNTHAKWRINSVFCVPSAFYLVETQDYFRQEFGITDFTINQCGMEKDALFSRNLPGYIKCVLTEKIKTAIKTHNTDQNLTGQFINCLIELEKPSNGVSYVDFFNDIDRRRGTNWKNVFPELIPC